MAFKLEHVHLKTREPQKTAKFYMENLGATLIEASDDHRHYRVNLHGIVMNITDHIETQTRDQHYGLEHFAIETDDFDATVRKISESGGRVLEQLVSPVPDHEGLRVCFMEGPEGVQLELIEKRAL
jgi:lactoylglutathione lyase